MRSTPAAAGTRREGRAKRVAELERPGGAGRAGRGRAPLVVRQGRRRHRRGDRRAGAAQRQDDVPLVLDHQGPDRAGHRRAGAGHPAGVRLRDLRGAVGAAAQGHRCATPSLRGEDGAPADPGSGSRAELSAAVGIVAIDSKRHRARGRPLPLVGDPLGALAQGVVVLPAPALGQELVGGGEAPALVADRDPRIAASQLASAGLAGAGSVGAEGLEMLLGVSTGPANVLVERHCAGPDGRGGRWPATCPQSYPQLGMNDRDVVQQLTRFGRSGPASCEDEAENKRNEPDRQVEVVEVVQDRRQDLHVEQQDVDDPYDEADDDLHRRRRDRSVRGGRAAMRLLPTPSLARPGMTLIVLALVLAACGGGGGGGGGSASASGAQIGSAPLVDRTPSRFQSDLAAYKGRVVVVNFWASWCGPCKAEMPALQQVSREYAGKPVTFIGVDSSDVRDSAGTLLADLKVTYPTVYDKAGINGGIATAWSVASLPQTWFIAKDGSRSGRIPRPLSAAELRNRIDQLLTAAA